MKLKKFIESLDEIVKIHGHDLEVIMADDISVVEPVYSEEYCGGNKVVLTDEK